MTMTKMMMTTMMGDGMKKMSKMCVSEKIEKEVRKKKVCPLNFTS